MKENKCINTLLLCVNSVLDSSQHDRGIINAISNGLMKDHTRSGSMEDYVSLTAEARYDFCVNASSCIDGASINSQASLSGDLKALRSSLDEMMNATYGDKLLYFDGGPCDSAWCHCWSVIIQHMGQHCSLPGGCIGKKYTDL